MSGSGKFTMQIHPNDKIKLKLLKPYWDFYSDLGEKLD